MNDTIKRKLTKITAILLALFIVINLVPNSLNLHLFANAAASYTVTLTDGTSPLNTVDGAVITLTNKSDPSKQKRETTTAGVATFQDFVEDNATYTIQVKGVAAYEDINDDEELTVTAGSSNTDIALTAATQITISGKVADENGNAYDGANVKLQGEGAIGTTTMTTKTDGTFQFQAYSKKDYVLVATAKEAKYAAAQTNIYAPTSDYECQTPLQFHIKQFQITTRIDGEANGTITDTIAAADYGSNQAIEVYPDENYFISSLTVDGASVSLADIKPGNGKVYTLLDVQDDHEIVVTFQKLYQITFTVKDDGTLFFGQGMEIPTGTIETEADNLTTAKIKAVPKNGYRVSKILIDDQEKESFSENDYQYDQTMNIANAKKVTVEFSPNIYTLNTAFALGSEDKGTISGLTDTHQYEYGTDSKLTITPKADYIVDEIMLKKGSNIQTVDPQTDQNYVENADDNSIQYTLKEIDSDYEIIVSFKELPTLSSNWQDDLKIDVASGNLVKQYSDADGNHVYVLSKQSVVKLSPQSTDYDRIAVSIDQFFDKWSEGINVSSSTVIDAVKVKKEKGGNAALLNLNQKKLIFIIDEDKPHLTVEKDEYEWTKEDVKVKGTVSDEANGSTTFSSGISHVVYSTKPISDMSQGTKVEIVKDAQGYEGTYEFDLTEEQNKTYYLYAVDNAGNISDAVQTKVKIDRSAPLITGYAFSNEENQANTEGISFVADGTIYYDTLYLTISVNEGNADQQLHSGLDKVILYCDGTQYAEAQMEDGKSIVVFALPEADFLTAKALSAVVTDKVGNQSVLKKPTDFGISSDQVKIDPAARPQIKIERDHSAVNEYERDNQYWYNGDIDFIVTVCDQVTGLKSVEIKLNGQTLSVDKNHTAIDEDFAAAGINEKVFRIHTGQVPKSGKNTIEVVAKSVSGASSKKADGIQSIVIDTDKPTITEWKLEPAAPISADTVLKPVNLLSFGSFYNDTMNVIISATDEGEEASGVKSISLITKDSDGNIQQEKELAADKCDDSSGNTKCTFYISASSLMDDEHHYFQGALSAVASDFVGNTIDQAVEPTDPNVINNGIKNSQIMIEDEKPQILVDVPERNQDINEITADGNIWYREDIDFTVDVHDAYSGIAHITADLNDAADSNTVDDDFKEEAAAVHDKEYKLHTGNTAVKNDGSYVLHVNAVDNANNVSVPFEKTIYIDKKQPTVVGFAFQAEEYVEGNGEQLGVVATDYGFYFKKDTQVTITAKDEAPSAGVKAIIYYTDDIDTGKSEEHTVLVDEKGRITFTVKANFKGQIYAKAVDNVNNMTESFVTPNSAVIESEEKHNAEKHIDFQKTASAYRSKSGSELYGEDVPVMLTITDRYSGIREVEWSVEAPYDKGNNQKGHVTVNNDGSLSTSEGKDIDWKITDREANLITEMQYNMVVNNNSNDIVVKVKMRDRAGNTSEKQLSFSIDKTAPVIEITYDNNDADQTYTNIFKANRTATVKVTERNFNPDDITYKITNTDGTIPKLSSWKEYPNSEDCDKSYALATVTFQADGDYTFDIDYQDLAKHKANKLDQQRFTVDKTMPKVTVAYDNNSAINTNYYKQARTATITINEHNFDASRVRIVANAVDDGNTLTYPSLSRWTNQGNIHTAKIAYTRDAHYTFDIEFQDKAGNSIADFKPQEFIVDKTAPTLEISGVNDQSANKDQVAPVITYSDTNFDKNTVNIQLSGVNNGVVNYQGAYADTRNGQTYTYSNFEKIKKVDDIYTLNVRLSDKAGNETQRHITFSTNRFGSNYSLEAIKNIIRQYLQQEQDIVFTEINVDSLNQGETKLKMTKNGSPRDLVENDDYTVAISGGSGQWSQYRYTVKRSLFKEDGIYSISVHSKDRSGNTNENADETKKAEIIFGIDKTDPIIDVIDVEENGSYRLDKKPVSISIKDNLKLADVEIYLNDQKVESNSEEAGSTEGTLRYTVKNDIYQFDIPQSNGTQTISVAAKDAAGNTYNVKLNGIVVSTNYFVLWFNNKPLFITSLLAVIAGIAGLAYYILHKKRKGQAEEAA